MLGRRWCGKLWRCLFWRDGARGGPRHSRGARRICSGWKQFSFDRDMTAHAARMWQHNILLLLDSAECMGRVMHLRIATAPRLMASCTEIKFCALIAVPRAPNDRERLATVAAITRSECPDRMLHADNFLDSMLHDGKRCCWCSSGPGGGRRQRGEFPPPEATSGRLSHR